MLGCCAGLDDKNNFYHQQQKKLFQPGFQYVKPLRLEKAMKPIRNFIS
jgi:hypothetical protein